MSNSLWPYGLYSPWNSPGQNTRVGSLSLLQGIFRTQGLNPGLPHCRWILDHLSHKGSPRTLEWVADPFFRESSWPRNQTRVSCIAGGFFTKFIDNVVLISGLGLVHSEVTPFYIHVYPLFLIFLRFFSQIHHLEVLSRVPCAMQ